MRTSYTEDSSVCGGKEFNVTGRSTELLSASWKKISRLLLELHIQVFAWRMKWDASGMEYHPVNWHRENCPFREDDLLINKGNVQKLNSNGIVVVHDGPFMWVWWGVFFSETQVIWKCGRVVHSALMDPDGPSDSASDSIIHTLYFGVGQDRAKTTFQRTMKRASKGLPSGYLT